MKKYFVLLIITVFFLLLPKKVMAAQTADPNALPVTKNLLDYFYSLPGKTSKKFISGQNIGGTWDWSRYDQYITSVHDKTGIGKYIAIVAIDGDDLNGNDPTVLITHWQRGGLISIANRPFTSPSNPIPPPSDFSDLYTPGTDYYQHFIDVLDSEAVFLSKLQSAGVVVLWRPFGEMNGNWSWWCNQDKNEYIQLWKYTFRYLTKTKQLHNLLWVYSPIFAYSYKWLPVSYYYPEPDSDNPNGYVDIVGYDYYHYYPDFVKMKYDYDTLLKYGKPFGLTEFGPDDVPSTHGTHWYDYSTLLTGLVANNLSQVTFFLSWRDDWSIINQNGTSALMNSNLILNAGDLPNFNLSPILTPTYTPTPTSSSCSLKLLGDFNCDLKINESDLNALLGKWMTNLNDITGDNIVNESDLNKLLGNWKAL
ncbi:glycoside hydrolase family 26 protein [Candidatus Microgenomates bacterium]|nr:glycoside hydrolase family 26 protein [Candidatus Microgenomates bacterium]